MQRLMIPKLVLGVIVAFAATMIFAESVHAEPLNLEKTFHELLPGMGAEKIAESQASQLQWETICRGLSAPGKETQRAEACRLMASKLGPKTAPAARIWLLRQLEYLGDAECVDAVAAAMQDKDDLVRRAARGTLEMIPAGAANAKLLHQLKNEDDEQFKIGLLNSIGNRGDKNSVAALTVAIGDENQKIVVAAARALGEIGTVEAARTLRAHRQATAGDLRLHLGNASLRCAKVLLANDRLDEAKFIWHHLYNLHEAESVRMAALYDFIRADPDQMEEVILSALTYSDLPSAKVAAGLVTELDDAAAKRIAQGLDKLKPAYQVAVLEALNIRSDKSVMPEVVAAVNSEDQAVRIAALRALSTVGDASVVPLLLENLMQGGEVASAARHGVEAVYGEGVDQKIIAAMQAAKETQPRALLIEVLHRRRSVAAVPALLEEAKHADVEIRRRAMDALSQLAEIDNVAKMIQGVLKSEKGSERDAAEKAIMLLCNRVAEKDKRADPVLAVFVKASASDQLALLPLLGRIGGPHAQEIIQAALKLKSQHKELYDVAVQALCNWPDGDVAPELLEIFQTSKDEGHQLRAMRAFIRVIALRHERSNAESLAMLKKAMEQCKRDEERNLILSRTISAEIRSIEALRFILPYMKNPATAQMACRAVVGLSHHRYLRRPNEAEFNKALGQVIEVSNNPALKDQARRYRSDL